MKINNSTHWNTRQLKRLILAVAKEEMDAEYLKSYLVTAKYRHFHDRGALGRATYGIPRNPGRRMTLYLPKPGREFDPVLWAHVVAHEFAHSRGIRHSQMRGSKRYSYVSGWREHYAWAKDYVVAPKAPRVVQIISKQEERYQRVIANLKRWQTKLKRAQNAIKKLTRQQKYYERAMAAKKAEKECD